MASNSSSPTKLEAPALALKSPPPMYTASAPFETAATMESREPAGAKSSGTKRPDICPIINSSIYKTGPGNLNSRTLIFSIITSVTHRSNPIIPENFSSCSCPGWPCRRIPVRLCPWQRSSRLRREHFCSATPHIPCPRSLSRQGCG